MKKTAKEMIDALIKKRVSKRRISAIVGAQWATVNNWHTKGQEPDDSHLKNLKMLFNAICNGRSK